MKKSDKLELRWPGKDDWEKPEPRLLLEKSSYGTRKSAEENLLIYGDNLLGLKALARDFTGKIKCVYIDPPFNTKSIFDYYDDKLEHSRWLNMIKERLVIIHKLLRGDGTLFIHLDDSEMAYAKVLLDEVFGRKNYLNTITMTTNEPSGFKATSSTIFSTANYLLVYSKNKNLNSLKKIYIAKEYDTAYSKVLLNPTEHYSKWKWESIRVVVAKKLGFDSPRRAKNELKNDFETAISEYALANSKNIFQTAAIGGGAAIKRAETIRKSKKDPESVFVHPNEDVDNFYILNGRQILFYKDRMVKIDGNIVPGEIITDVWTDISWTGIAGEGGVEFKNGKKPEALIKRVLELSTNPKDLILDCFAGSGTTGAVAHKMGRKWIMIELKDHCHSHIIPRLQKVIDGSDKSGISEVVGWEGGGGFRYCNLAPSLLEKNKFNRWTISKKYNPVMLIEAMCKLDGYTFNPRGEPWWMHGQSNENDFIFVTATTLTRTQLIQLSQSLGESQSLLVYCGAFRGDPKEFENLTIKKIPKSILPKCEWGRDDYSLKIALQEEAKRANQRKPKTQHVTSSEVMRMPLAAKGGRS